MSLIHEWIKKTFMIEIVICFSTILPGFVWLYESDVHNNNLYSLLIFQSFYKINNKIAGIQTSWTDKKCLVSHTEFEIQ